MQGDPLAKITYGIGIIPLINNLKREIPDITQPWYDDNAGALGTFARLETYFDSLTCQGPGRGYYPKIVKERTDCTPRESRGSKSVSSTSRI